jgi:signal transduction histidine kinase
MVRFIRKSITSDLLLFMPSPSEPAGVDPVVSSQLRALGDFIIARREDITRYWVGAVDRSPRVESSTGLTFRQVLDHFPLLCSELADTLKWPAAEAPREQASRDSASHGRRRWQQGYRLDETIREICIIRRDFLIRWLETFETENGAMTSAAKKAAKRVIHEFFDNVMIDSTLQFVEEHDGQIKEFGHELAGEKQRREQATHAKAQFLALISHELRTPLTPMLLDLAVLEKDGRLPDELRPSLMRIRHNIEVETALIDDLLDATRLTQRTLELQVGEVDVHELLLAEIAAAELNYLDKQLDLQVQLHATVTRTTGDSGRLRRSFAALLRNAANVSAAGSVVSVNTRNTDDGRQIEIAVEDTGSDLDAELAERVFSPFETGRRSTFGVGRLGVARYVAKAVIESHGGTLVAKPGATKAAVYMISLPVRL